jgi:hypothetical protein
MRRSVPATAYARGIRSAARHGVLRLVARLLPKRISAMMRVRNEEEFLAAAARSIVDDVEELVLIDNGSRDATPAVIESLQRAYPDKVRAYRYGGAIAAVGSDTWTLVERSRGASPHLSGTYYNWCLRRCTNAYVLKWDGDMIATPAFHRAIAAWRGSPAPVLMMRGANVHADGRHLVAARSADHAALLRQQGCPRMPAWVASMTYSGFEPRLYPRFRAHYDHAAGFTQSLVSPFLDRRFKVTLREVVTGVAYLHLKFCKRDPYSNYSADLARVIAGNLVTGPRLDADAQFLLEHWGCHAATARRA